jgi:uncharacterized protein (DUF1330 family)
MSEAGVLVVVEVRSISDPEKFKQYQAGAREQIGRRGGRVLARGSTPFEGEPSFGAIMVQQWPSAEAFAQWQESEEYRPLREIRRSCADLRIATVPLT